MAMMTALIYIDLRLQIYRYRRIRRIRRIRRKWIAEGLYRELHQQSEGVVTADGDGDILSTDMTTPLILGESSEEVPSLGLSRRSPTASGAISSTILHIVHLAW